ncbi:MAG: phosphoribosylglycinamide formyltransferase [Myxococcota bacterium]
MNRFAILISGRGSNMASILNFWAHGPGSYPTHASVPVVVVSNRPDAPGLDLARDAGVPTEVVDHRALGSKAAFEAELLSVLERYDVHGLVLAGFMRVLSPAVVSRFPERILNVHPSLLPSFAGLDAPGQAIAAGVKVSGCTIHFVEAAVDAGPIIAQAAVPVLETDTSERLQSRIQRVEHHLYPKVIAKVFAGQYERAGRIIALEGGGP